MEKNESRLYLPPVPAPRWQQSFLGGIGATLGPLGVVILAIVVWALQYFGVGR